MKSLLTSIKSFIMTLTSLLTFGLISADKSLKKAFRVDLLKVKLNELEQTKMQTYDKKIKVHQDVAVIAKDIKNIDKDLVNLKAKLEKAKANNNTAEFSTLALQYKTKETILSSKDETATALETTLSTIENTLKALDRDIVALKSQIEIISAKQDTYETLKSVNEVMGKLHAPIGEDSTIINDLKNELENDVIRETVKGDILQKDIPQIKVDDFASTEDMDAFLKTIN